MLNDKILEFYSELREEVQDYVKTNGPVSVNTAFKTLFLSYLTETGETLVSDCTLVDFKKDSENMRLDGYAFSEYFRSLTLLVSKYQAKAIPDKIKKTELDKLMRKAVKFYKTCQTNYFEELEESSDGYQAYEFIKAHRADIETVNIIFLTNDEVVQFVPEDISYGKISIKFDVWDIERLYQSIFSGTAVERQLVIKLKKKYAAPLHLIKVNGSNDIYDCYIGVISGELLARIYKDEGQELIQKNVRSFLQATGKVNKGIVDGVCGPIGDGLQSGDGNGVLEQRGQGVHGEVDAHGGKEEAPAVIPHGAVHQIRQADLQSKRNEPLHADHVE